jgi:4-hydroxybenzoyl-CoA reductase subunit beta
MEFMPEFEVLKPATVAEAVGMRAEHDEARFLAGGTDIVPNIRRGIVEPGVLIELSGIAEMNEILETGDGGLKIGAGVTLSTLESDARIQDNYSAIAKAASEVAANSHRNAGTLGGNLCLDTRCVFYNPSEWWRKSNDYCLKYRGEICHVAPKSKRCFAAFSGDLAPALMIMDATVDIVGPKGRRTVPLADIYQPDGAAHLLIDRDEILVGANLPANDGWITDYGKIRVRTSIDFPLAGIAIALKREGETLSGLKIAVTGLDSEPIQLEGTDGLLGRPFDASLEEGLAGLLPKQIQPMTSTFTPPGYRRRVSSNLIKALARELFQAA